MANNLGVVINEVDKSQSASALAVPAGAMALYSIKGPTEKAYFCQSENDIRRLFGQPQAFMKDDGGTFYDYQRGLQNAFRFVRAGLPMYIKRAIPETLSGGDNSDGKAFSLFQKEATGSANDHAIRAVAKGHGQWYDGLSVYIKGVATVQTQVTLDHTKPVSIGDNVLPGSLVISDTSGKSSDSDADILYSERSAGTKTLTTSLAGTVTVVYEDSTVGKYTSLQSAANDVTVNISYEQTTQQRLVRLFIVHDGETDPVNNNYENYLVSFMPEGTDQAGNGVFIEDVINGISELIDIHVGGSYAASTLPVYYGVSTASDITNAHGELAGGVNGTYGNNDADIVIALEEFDPTQKNGRYYDILYMFDAGYSIDVKKALGDIAAKKLFPHVYCDPYSGGSDNIFLDSGNKLKSGLIASKVANQICAWRSGLGNRMFMSLSGSCWGLITDTFNGGRNLWVGPTYEVGAAAIIVDNTLGSWNSVMGPRRGVTSFNKLAINLYDYRNQLNAKQVNPLIVDERGIQMYYGNKTLQVTASAMQQTHARKTRGRISREMLFSALNYVAENLVQSTFNGLRDEFEVILDQHYGQALESFSLVVGPPATTKDDINNQILRITVGLIFNQIAEEINITTVVMRNGTDLTVAVV